QPAHWVITFPGPRSSVQAEYWVGNRSVTVRRTESGFFATLTNLHKGIGMPVGWILLVDTLAGSILLLSLSGVALWMLTRRERAPGVLVLGLALALLLGLAMSHT
ncbi:MAG TPA: PepSY-associated TM helix domain-containing protein, partial [Burkholderiaceae bacterium]